MSGKSKPHRLRCPGCGVAFLNGISTGAVGCPAECGYHGSCVRITNDGHPKNKHLAPLTSWAVEMWRRNGDKIKRISLDPRHITIYMNKDIPRPVVLRHPPGSPRRVEYEYE